jgi:hypothetical protein
MGIRFLCPNGHKLNVKSFLAGKKAFCPVCGVRLTVPRESTLPAKHPKHEAGVEAEKPAAANSPPSPGWVPADAPLPANPPASMAAFARSPVDPTPSTAPLSPVLGPSMTAMAAPGPVAAPLQAPVVPAVPDVPAFPAVTPAPLPAGPPDPLAETGDVVWYVRPPSGGQYGPATSPVMRGWIQEGRVSADSLVWREGWRDWQEAGGVFPQLTPGGENGSKAAPAGSGAAPRIQPRRRSNTVPLVVISILILAVIVLAVVFAWVMMRPAADARGTNAPPAKPTAMILRPAAPDALGT